MNQNQSVVTRFKPPLDGTPTPVKEVDSTGKLIGKSYFSTHWDTRNRPADRQDGCKIWLNKIVVTQTAGAADLGAGLVDSRAVPAASSSPSSRDVTVIELDAQGAQIRTFQVPFVFVRSAGPVPDDPLAEIAKEIWFSDQPFELTEVAGAERICNASSSQK